jgi:hypothetical protein
MEKKKKREREREMNSNSKRCTPIYNIVFTRTTIGSFLLNLRSQTADSSI